MKPAYSLARVRRDRAAHAPRAHAKAAWAHDRRPGGRTFDVEPLMLRVIEECPLCLDGGDRLRISAVFHPGLALGAEEAMALVFAVSGLIGNALDHAHPDGAPVAIALSSAPDGRGGMALEVADDGVGLPPGFEEWRHAGRGLMSIRGALHRVGARLDIASDDLGARFRLGFKAR